ncbi:MAG: hypothetical protein LQ349_000833 [Xanthoria aureola]|nr:MAG: hypothetical protein LQ349_000833 [Xanthoria aureola]
MPEIGEVARIVNYLHKHLVGKTLAVVKAQHDENVFGKVGTSAAEFEKQLTGKKVVDARQQGKYFWLVMSSPPHPLFHFGMAGWWKIRDLETAYYKPTKKEEATWPPKYWKFTLETADDPKSEHAFVDFRRFGRIRLVDCAADEMRNVSPLKENGPDPVADKDVLTEEWLVQKLQSKHVPVKALLLDQANISGIGNWVGDELLYDAKIHPEQYSNTLNPAQMKQLHKSIHYVCSTAVDLLAESDRFPEEWLFKHRWGKGKKDAPQRLPNGEKIKFLTVGGRTSAIVPSVQKKTGEVAADVKEGDSEDEDGVGEDDAEKQKPTSTKRKARDDGEEEDDRKTAPKKKSNKKPPAASRGTRRAMKDEEADTAEPNGVNGSHQSIEDGTTKAQQTANGSETPKSTAGRKQKASKPPAKTSTEDGSHGRRRSTRVSRGTR